MLRAWIKTVFFILLLAASALRAEPSTVARVGLAVGEATRVNAAGLAEPLRLGTRLATGDRIITGKDAIAILVFADEGRVSLRADSELVIRRYHVDPSGADTRLELDLVRGAMRQISGDAARLQPERYRLNTPVAAIGVRGTDFLAKSSGNMLETFVHEGMIVVLPMNGRCTGGGAVADCAPIAALSASDAGQYLRVTAAGAIERRAVNPEEIENLFGIKIVGARGVNDPARGAAPGVVFVAGVGADVLKGLNRRDSWVGETPDLLAARELLRAVEADLLAAGGTKSVSVELPRQLVWGRFSNADSLLTELPVAYGVAREGRHVTVGELGRYALWRADPAGQLASGLQGQVEFNLAASEAVFAQASGVSPAAVRAASLRVDFDRSVFGAGVTVAHAQTGDVSLTVNGAVNNQGVFWGGNAAQRVAGALSLDGREAGYLFTKEHALGTFKGVTLWNTR